MSQDWPTCKRVGVFIYKKIYGWCTLYEIQLCPFITSKQSALVYSQCHTLADWLLYTFFNYGIVYDLCSGVLDTEGCPWLCYWPDEWSWASHFTLVYPPIYLSRLYAVLLAGGPDRLHRSFSHLLELCFNQEVHAFGVWWKAPGDAKYPPSHWWTEQKLCPCGRQDKSKITALGLWKDNSAWRQRLF